MGGEGMESERPPVECALLASRTRIKWEKEVKDPRAVLAAQPLPIQPQRKWGEP